MSSSNGSTKLPRHEREWKRKMKEQVTQPKRR